MLFNSYDYFIFLVSVLIGAAVLRKFHKPSEIWFLIAASAFFYGQWNWTYLLLIYITIVSDYILGLKIYDARNPKKYLIISLWVNLGILGFFKYANLLISSTNQVLDTGGFDYNLQALDILLPVGISFYTFQSLSYTIDVYRKNLQPRKKIADYALFVSFFPQLVAGPIVRASEFFEQLDKKRKFSYAGAQAGVMMILIGLVKKVVFADNLALIVDPVFNNPENANGWMTLVAIYAFAFQIYFDFSGYTDIAIGSALLLGFKFPQNFNHPYIALSIRDFWRRWHMTLSRWLRDYLYISLGGNRGSTLFTGRNLFLTMFLGGLWHGASWNFAFWGTLHGLYLAVERYVLEKSHFWNHSKHIFSKLFKWFITFHLVCFAWIFFRAKDFSDSWQIIGNLTDLSSSVDFGAMPTHIALLVLCFPILHWLSAKIQLINRSGELSTVYYSLCNSLLLLALVIFAAQSQESFIYFQF
ncbi:MBOAT family O-acyltransferase [Marinicella sp. W31]|uniref:MBOAT family O-acyltransferase n=1 Tax=Marinicella sp. W31 TaxID=3023713 RepID=UPI0037581035